MARPVQPLPASQPHWLRTACWLAGACFVVYLTSLRCSPSWDTIPARLLPFSVLREGNVDLNEFPWLHRSTGGTPYFLRQTANGRLMSMYPVAAPLLATPVALPALWWLGHHQVSDGDVRFRLTTVVVERITASLIAALSVSLLYLALCRITSSTTALAIALAYGLGSNTWSTSSQALWQHTLAEFSLAGLSLFLLGADTRRNAVAASVFAALGALARPTMAIFAVLAAVFVWHKRRHRLPAFMALPVSGLVCLVLYNVRSVGSALGGYAAGISFGEHASISFVEPSLMRFLGLLLSPNRGLLFFTPTAALAIPGVLRWRSHRAPWIPYLAAGILLYLLLYSSFWGWWGGHSYGPRFLIDVLPAVALCAVPTVERLRPLPLGRAALGALVAWSVGVQAIGAYCDVDYWNHVPVSVNSRDQRVWDWSDLQIVRALRGGWHGTDLGPLLWQMLTDPRPALLSPLNPTALAADIAVEGALPLRYQAGRFERLIVRITNRGTAIWPVFSDYGHLDCRVVGVWKLGGETIEEGSFSLVLPRNLGPGESVQIASLIDTPVRRAAYELDLSLVQLLDNRSGIFGGAHQRVPVQVE
jgi:hypothetical protein